MMTQQKPISDAAVQQATGKTWDEWFRLLDAENASDLAHRDIVKLIQRKQWIDRYWWCQTVTEMYEKSRGKRVVGETATTGFQIGVQRTLPITPKQAWRLITGPRGRAVWLGDVGRMRWAKGSAYESKDGTQGEVRSITDGNMVRLTWLPPDRSTSSTIQLRISGAGNKTAIKIHHEKLVDQEDREQMRQFWNDVLDKWAEIAAVSTDAQ